MRRKIIFFIWILTISGPNIYALLNITNISPTNREMNVSRSAVLQIYFDQTINSNTLGSSNIYLLNSDKNFVPCHITSSGNSVTLSPFFIMEPNDFHIITITTNVKSLSNDHLSNNTNFFFYTTIGPECPHNVSGIDWVNDTGWETNDYITYDYRYSEVTINEHGDTMPTWGAITNFWISWTTNNTFYRIKTTRTTGAPYYTAFFVDTTRDDHGAHSFTFRDGSTVVFSDYRYPEMVCYYTNAGGGYWTSGSGWTTFFWNGSSWNSGSGNGFKNHKDYPDTEGMTTSVPNSYFSTGSLTGNMPNRVAVLAMNMRNGEYDTAPENGHWITYDIDNDGNDISDGVPLPPPPPLQVVNTSPNDGAKQVPLNTIIQVVFNSNINSSTVNNTNFIVLDNNYSEVAGSLSVSGNQITFTPSQNLNPLADYTVIVGDTIESPSGSTLASPYSFSFTSLYPGPFYVDAQNGNDNNSGTSNAPFKTIEGTLSVMKNDTVNTAYCRGNFLDSSKPIYLTNRGSLSNPIVIRNWNTTPVLDRGNAQTGFFINHCTNIIIQGFYITAVDNDPNDSVFVMQNSAHISLISNRYDDSSIKQAEAIEVSSVNNLTINHCFFSYLQDGFYANSGSFSNLRVLNTTFSNIGQGNGTYGFYFNVDIKNIVISNTIIAKGNMFPIYTVSGYNFSNLKIQNCQFFSNTVPTYIVYFNHTGDSLTLISNRIYDNTGMQYAFRINQNINNFVCIGNYFESADFVIYVASAIDGLVLKKNYFFSTVNTSVHFSGTLNNAIIQSNFFYTESGQYGLRINSAGANFLSGANQEERAIMRNVFVLNGGPTYEGLYLYGSTSQDFVIRNNTLIGNFNRGIQIGTGGNISVRNNIIQDTIDGKADYGVMQYGGTITADYNCITNVTTSFYSVSSVGGNNITFDAQFENQILTDWLSTNFVRLSSTSPCIDGGHPIDDALPEVFGVHIDIGAFESINVRFPDLHLTNSYSVTGPGGASKYVPGNTITVSVYYDNDSISASYPSITISLPTNVSYVSNSASVNNTYHTGETGTTVEVFNGISWLLDSGAYDPNTIIKIRWKFNTDVGAQDNSEGTDTLGNSDGSFPDIDAGFVTYKITIK